MAVTVGTRSAAKDLLDEVRHCAGPLTAQ